MSLSIMRRFTFCAGHRLVGHEGKCQNLHGHNYTLEVYVTGREQDEVGRILDFKAQGASAIITDDPSLFISA